MRYLDGPRSNGTVSPGLGELSSQAFPVKVVQAPISPSLGELRDGMIPVGRGRRYWYHTEKRLV